jgi:superfamily II DNA or RNA helicase
VIPELRTYQAHGVNALRRHVVEGRNRIILVCPTGGGKCLGLGTPVLTFDGRIVRAENVEVGDLLMGPDSKPRRVLSTCRGHGPLYRITPIKGTSWICNNAHVLTLVETVSGSVVDISVDEYLQETKWFRHTHKQFSPDRGVDFAPSDPLPVDPYFVGVWIGDGTKGCGAKGLLRVDITKMDSEILDLAKKTARKWGLRVRTDGPSTGRCPTHHLVGKRKKGVQHVKNPLLDEMRRLFGEVTEIPRLYLTASRSDRELLLAGLIDTDGYIHNATAEIVQKRRGIADGICFLARSLGYRVLMSKKIVKGTAYWRMSISGDLSSLPMRISRKRSPARRQKKCTTRTGFEIRSIGKGQYAGFELDGDGRFLLGDFTVTHNTVLASNIIHSARRNFNAKILFVAHRRELIDQAVRQLERWGVTEVGVVRADDERTNALMPVQVATIQSLGRRNPPPADIIFVDECHRAVADSYRKLLEIYPEKNIIGLTATPCRMDGKALGDVFQAIEVAATYKDLIKDGFIVEPRCYGTPVEVKLEGVHTQHGDYVINELEGAMLDANVLGDTVAEYQKHAGGRRTVVFAVSVSHSLAIKAQFEAAGVKIAHVDASTPESERLDISRKLDAGELEVVTNVGIYTEGWDQPCVKCAIVARPTKSLVLWMQMPGRILRPWNPNTPPSRSWQPEDGPSVQPIIIDQGNNIDYHGFPHEDRTWSLEKSAERTEKRPARCIRCFAYIRHYPCPACGYMPEVSKREVRADQNTELQERQSVDPRKAFFDRKIQEARVKGFKPGWASKQYFDAYGDWPLWSWSQAAKDALEADVKWQRRIVDRASNRDRWRSSVEAELHTKFESDEEFLAWARRMNS